LAKLTIPALAPSAIVGEAEQMSDILQALYGGDAARARELAQSAASLDVFEAAALGDERRIRELLAADSTAASAFATDGFTALHLAAFFAHPDAVRVLLAAGAPPNAVSGNAMRVQPLHAAAVQGDPVVLTLLLDAGADPNGRQQGGFTPLQARALRGDVAGSRLLLARGADPDLRSEDGRSALDIARAQGHAELIALLEARTSR
jgi:uncharacterized protein